MKRLALGLTACALVAGSAGAATAQQEIPKPRVYVDYCGTTVMMACYLCVAIGTYDLACIPM